MKWCGVIALQLKRLILTAYKEVKLAAKEVLFILLMLLWMHPSINNFVPLNLTISFLLNSSSSNFAMKSNRTNLNRIFYFLIIAVWVPLTISVSPKIWRTKMGKLLLMAFHNKPTISHLLLGFLIVKKFYTPWTLVLPK